MDNFALDITSIENQQLRNAFKLFSLVRDVVGYSVNDDKEIIFYHSDSPAMHKLPFKMTLEQAADFAYGWLRQANYGPTPDHDGDNEKGWRLYCEQWGFVHGDRNAFAAVQPIWAMYGK